MNDHDLPPDPATAQPTANNGRTRPPRGRISSRLTPGKTPVLHYAKPREHRLVRWLRYKREFLLEELRAWKEMVIAVLVGILFVAAVLIFLLPRTSIRLMQLFGGH